MGVADAYPGIGSSPQVLTGVLTLAAIPAISTVGSSLVLGGLAFAIRSAAAVGAVSLHRQAALG
jgi:hypothetical protein